MTTDDVRIGIRSLFCTSSSVATTCWDAGSVGDSEGSALRCALVRAGSACLDAKKSIGPKGRPRAQNEAAAGQTAAIDASSSAEA